MQLAKVLGAVVATQKSASLSGRKLMIVRRVNIAGDANPGEPPLEEVAVDSVGAGVGELVLIARGNPARSLFQDPSQAIDLAIVGIVDSIDAPPAGGGEAR